MKNNEKKVKRSIKALMESLLEDYPKYYAHVEQREYELKHPVSGIDENVGGSSAKNNYQNPIERSMIRTEDDTYLNELKKIHFDVQTCYEEANPEVKTICEKLYFTNHRYRKYHTIEGLVNDGVINVSRSQAYREWDDFIYTLAYQLGFEKFMIYND